MIDEQSSASGQDYASNRSAIGDDTVERGKKLWVIQPDPITSQMKHITDD